MSVDREMVGQLLEAIASAGGFTEHPPNVADLSRDELLVLVEDALRRNWLQAGAQNRGDNRLMSVRNLSLTEAGMAALVDLRKHHRGGSVTSGDSSPLSEKKRRRLEFMNALYGITNGSPSEITDMWALGEELGWDRPDIDQTVEYLEAEGLLRFVAMGGAISITHSGVIEVEQSLSQPETSTLHFPPAINIINVQRMVGSQIQQGTSGSSQQMEYIDSRAGTDILGLIEELRRSLLPVIELEAGDRDELDTELDVIERRLKSKRANKSAVRESLERVGLLVEKASVISGSTVQLTEYVMRLHELLPGI